MSYDLVPLKVSSGWNVVFNDFRFSDNQKNNETVFQKENLLVMTHPLYGKIIDLGWYKFRNEGEYCLVLADFTEGAEQLGYWTEPVYFFQSVDISKTIDAINIVLNEVSEGKYPVKLN